MKTIGLTMAALAALAATAAFAAPKQNAKQDAELKEKLKAIAVRLDADRVTYGNWNNGYLRLHCGYKGAGETRVTSAEYAAMQTRYLAALAERDALVPKDLKHLVEYGEALMYKGDFAAAKDVLARAVALNGKSYEYAQACYRHAECLFALGDRAGCVRELEALKARGIQTARRGRPSWSGLASGALTALKGFDATVDLMCLPAFTDAKAYPEPQQVVYSEDFVPVSGYDLEVRGLEPNDRRLELLDVKFARFGAPKRKDAGFKVSVAVDPATKAFDGLKDKAAFAAFRAKKFAARTDNADGKAVDTSPKEFCDYMENEAYVLEVTKEGAKIVAKTKQGALWGIVSLIQLWDQERHAIRLAKIRDWPDVAIRGYLGYFWAGTLEFTLFNKMNSVCHQKHPCFDNLFRPVNWYIEAFMGRQFHDFGLELFFGNCWMTHAPQLPMCSPRTLVSKEPKPHELSLQRR